MEILSLCPLPAAPLTWQPAPSRWALTVVCKATYRLEPGIAALAADQEPIHERENHWDDDPSRSVFAPADLIPVKPRADVVLVGNAYARNGQPVRSLTVRMNIGKIDKSIEVLCARLRTRDGELREGKRWAKMPLLWERAAGGPDTDNPVGLGRDGPRDPYGQVPLPNLQPPGFGEAGDKLAPPVGYGPIGESWPTRRRKAAYVDADRDYVRMPFGEGFEPAFFQVAPLDQQVDSIRPNERIALENLHPKHALLVTNLPGIQPRARVELRGAAAREVPLVGDTLWIDTHRAICTVTFRARIDIENKDQEGRILIATSKGDQAINWAKIAPPPPPPRSSPVAVAAAPAPRVVPAPPPPPPPSTRAPLLAAKVPVPPPPPVLDAYAELDPEMLESVDITMSENHIPQLEQTAALRPITQPQPLTAAATAAAESTALPFQPARPGWQSPAAIPSRPRSGSSPALPDWFDSGAAPVASDQAATLDLPAWTPPGGRAAMPLPVSLPAAVPPPAPPAPVPPAPPAVVSPPPPPPPPPPVSMSSAQMAPPQMAPPQMAPPQMAPPQMAPPQMAPPQMAPPPSAPPPVPPPPVPPPVVAPPLLGAPPSDGSFSALEASNAAARNREAPPVPLPVRVETERPAPSVAAVLVAELIWFDAMGVLKAAHSPALSQWKRPPPASKTVDVAADPNALEELVRGQVYEAITRGFPIGTGAELDAALETAEEESPPHAAVVLAGGILELCLDEVEMLKAVISAATPLASSDKKLKETIDVATEMLKAPMQGMPDFAEGLSARIRDAWAKANRMMPPEHLAVCTERLLLEQRSYQKRALWDDEWIRCLLTSPGGEPALPTYIPAKIAKRLPLFRRFPARVIGEVVWQQDQYEAHPLALRALALGRLPGRSRQGARRRRA